MFMRFANPFVLLLLAAIPLLVYWQLRTYLKSRGSLRFSHLGIVKTVATRRAEALRGILFVLRILTLILLIVAIARPQAGLKGEEVTTQGIDIVLALDVSSSMLAEDIEPNRFNAAKAVAAEFIQGRKNDRIGIVVFSGEAFTQCPLTLDYAILLRFLEEFQVGMIEDGTAIGMGLATAVNRLRNSEAKSKVIILLTDGRNNRGEIDPVTASQAADALSIRIYTIGAGTQGTALYPVDDPLFGRRYVPMRVDIDDAALTRIAEMTGGKYFRATNRERLSEVYREIDAMEKTKINVREYTRYSERFLFPAGLALFLLLLEFVLSHTRLKKIP